MYCIEVADDPRAPKHLKGEEPCDYNEQKSLHPPNSKCPFYLSLHKQVVFNGWHRKTPVRVDLTMFKDSNAINFEFTVGNKDKGCIDIKIDGQVPMVAWPGHYYPWERRLYKDIGTSEEGRKCSNCGSGPLGAVFVDKGFDIWKCQNCGKKEDFWHG